MRTPDEICALCRCLPADMERHHCSPEQKADEQLRRKHALEADCLKDGIWLHLPPIGDQSIGK